MLILSQAIAVTMSDASAAALQFRQLGVGVALGGAHHITFPGSSSFVVIFFFSSAERPMGSGGSPPPPARAAAAVGFHFRR